MKRLCLILALTILAPTLAWAQPEPATNDGTVLRIGTKVAPPFAIKGADGTWSGLSIDLWTGVAAELGVDYEFVETDLDGLLAGLEDGLGLFPLATLDEVPLGAIEHVQQELHVATSCSA